MRNEYEMVTLVDYLNNDNVETLQEQEIAARVEKYLLSQKRYETNAKIVEALLA